MPDTDTAVVHLWIGAPLTPEGRRAGLTEAIRLVALECRASGWTDGEIISAVADALGRR